MLIKKFWKRTCKINKKKSLKIENWIKDVTRQFVQKGIPTASGLMKVVQTDESWGYSSENNEDNQPHPPNWKINNNYYRVIIPRVGKDTVKQEFLDTCCKYKSLIFGST